MIARRNRGRAGLTFALFGCAQAAALQACAADTGDGPKGEGDGSSISEGGEDVVVDSFAPVAESGADSAIPPSDSAGGKDSGVVMDSATSEAGPADVTGMDAVITCTSCPLIVQYMTTTTMMMSNEIRPQFQIVNNGASPENLAALKLRYWYTAQGSTSQVFACDYFAGASGCGSVQAAFVAMPTPAPQADHYMEVSFTSGSIPSGGSAGQLQTRFHDTNYAVTFDQTQDYSFNASDTTFTTWNHVTLYRNGQLIFGVEP